MDNKNLEISYEVAEMPESNRYWFRRQFFDEVNGKQRTVIVSIERLAQGDWSLRLEDRKSSTFWQLLDLSIDGVERKVFERFSRVKSGVKNDYLSLGYLPRWVIKEIERVLVEMRARKMDLEGRKFLREIIRHIKLDRKEIKSKLTAVVEKTNIGGLFRILAQTRGDERGSFREVVRFPEVELLTGYDFVGKQVNHSHSIYGTLRGLHVEPWAKLVTVISGVAACVLLDCRPKSKTFGKTEVVYLGFGKTPDEQEVKGGAIFIEQGIANSFIVLSEQLDYSYVVDDLWTPGTATYAINPMDPELAIPWTDWVEESKIIRSERDINSPSFKEFTKSLNK